MFVCVHSTVSDHRSRLQRGLAVFFVALYVLAAVRGLVPGLCLNLRAPVTEDGWLAAASVAPADAARCCVRVDSAPGGDSGSPPVAPERCPFCRLALGLTETPTFVHFNALPAGNHGPYVPVPMRLVAAFRDRALPQRGPPSIISA